MVKDNTGARIRIRQKETEYIQKIADQNQETFLDALYRIVNYHRNANLKCK